MASHTERIVRLRAAEGAVAAAKLEREQRDAWPAVSGEHHDARDAARTAYLEAAAVLEDTRRVTMPEVRRNVIEQLAELALEEWLDLRGLPGVAEVEKDWPMTGVPALDELRDAFRQGIMDAYHGDHLDPSATWTPDPGLEQTMSDERGRDDADDAAYELARDRKDGRG